MSGLAKIVNETMLHPWAGSFFSSVGRVTPVYHPPTGQLVIFASAIKDGESTALWCWIVKNNQVSAPIQLTSSWSTDRPDVFYDQSLDLFLVFRSGLRSARVQVSAGAASATHQVTDLGGNPARLHPVDGTAGYPIRAGLIVPSANDFYCLCDKTDAPRSLVARRYEWTGSDYEASQSLDVILDDQRPSTVRTFARYSRNNNKLFIASARSTGGSQRYWVGTAAPGNLTPGAASLVSEVTIISDVSVDLDNNPGLFLFTDQRLDHALRPATLNGQVAEKDVFPFADGQEYGLTPLATNGLVYLLAYQSWYSYNTFFLLLNGDGSVVQEPITPAIAGLAQFQGAVYSPADKTFYVTFYEGGGDNEGRGLFLANLVLETPPFWTNFQGQREYL